MSMNDILAKLAGVSQNDEYAFMDEVNLNPEIAAEIENLRKEERAQSVRQAASVVMKLMNESSAQIDALRKNLAEVRIQEKALQQKIRLVAVARQYGVISNDYRPLSLLLAGNVFGGIQMMANKEARDKAEKIVTDQFTLKKPVLPKAKIRRTPAAPAAK